MRGRFAGIVADAAAHNLFVIPIAVGDKVPLEKWKHLQSRAPTPEEIADWCDRFPNANGAFVTGAIQGRIVVDTDSEAGSEYVEKREVPETQMVRTRERRLHYHFRHPGFPVRNSAGELYDDVDVRGDGGLATAPGSIGKTGYVYRWEPGHSPAEIELASAPNWLIDWLYEQHQRRCARSPITDPRPFDGAVGNWARAAIDRELETLAAARNGTRNATLARVSFKLGQLVGGGEADGETVRAALEAIASSWKDERSKSSTTIARALDEGMAHPRRRPEPQPRHRNPWAHTPGLAGEYEEEVDAGGRGQETESLSGRA